MELVGLKEALDQIGNIKESFVTETANPLHSLMLFISNKITDELKAELAKTTGQASVLSQSIEPLIVEENGSIAIHIKANDYWKFVEEGVNGLEINQGSPYSFKTLFHSRKMAESLQGWMGRGGIGTAATYKDMSWGAAVNIKKHGIKPKHFVDNVLSENFMNDIEKMVSDEMGKLVYLSIK